MLDRSIGPTRMTRGANKFRDRVAWKSKLDAYSGKKFRRRFKISRKIFAWIADKIAHHVEPDDWGKVMAIKSSGSFIPSGINLAITLRYLS